MALPQPILDFYLTRSPHAKSDKPDSRQSINLSSLGWEKTNLDRLMKWILLYHLDKDEQNTIAFSIATQIDAKTVQHFNNHPADWMNCSLGGVFCIKRNINADENNSIRCILSETYATCFFRHIRNSIAHGNYVYDEEADLVCFSDQASGMDTNKPRLNAIFQTSICFLNRLIEIVEAGPDAIPDSKTLNEQLNGRSYQIKRNVQALVNESGAKDEL